MALDDIKVTYPKTIPERIPRTRDWKKWDENYDAIFRRKHPETDTQPEEETNG